MGGWEEAPGLEQKELGRLNVHLFGVRDELLVEVIRDLAHDQNRERNDLLCI